MIGVRKEVIKVWVLKISSHTCINPCLCQDLGLLSHINGYLIFMLIYEICLIFMKDVEEEPKKTSKGKEKEKMVD